MKNELGNLLDMVNDLSDATLSFDDSNAKHYINKIKKYMKNHHFTANVKNVIKPALDNVFTYSTVEDSEVDYLYNAEDYLDDLLNA